MKNFGISNDNILAFKALVFWHFNTFFWILECQNLNMKLTPGLKIRSRAFCITSLTLKKMFRNLDFGHLLCNFKIQSSVFETVSN